MSNSAQRFSKTFRQNAAASAAADGFLISDPDACLEQVYESKNVITGMEVRSWQMPGYWKGFHINEALFWGNRLGMSNQEVRGVVLAFAKAMSKPENFSNSQPTDQVGCWGPTIAAVLYTAKRMGLYYWPIFCEEMDFCQFYHLGEAFFWSYPEREWNNDRGKYVLTGKIFGMSRRRWDYWKLLTSLDSWGVNVRRLPFTVIKGIDRLGGRAFRIARAMLRRDLQGYQEEKIVPEVFFRELNDFLIGVKDPKELWSHLPKGDFCTVFGNEDDRLLNEVYTAKNYGHNLSKAHLYALSQVDAMDQKLELFDYKPAQIRWALWRVQEGEFTSVLEALQEVGRLDTRWGEPLDPALTQKFSSYEGASAVPYAGRFGKALKLTVDGHPVMVSSDSDEFLLFSESAEVLVDETDGVKLYYNPNETVEIHRVEGLSGWIHGTSGDYDVLRRQFCLKQKGTGRTFHSRMGNAKEAAKEAIRAWRRQAELEKANANLVGFLKGDEGFAPLIYFQDSRSAGNCASGTTNWLRRHGWEMRKWIPASWLIPHLDYSLVRNVAMKVYRDFH